MEESLQVAFGYRILRQPLLDIGLSREHNRDRTFNCSCPHRCERSISLVRDLKSGVAGIETRQGRSISPVNVAALQAVPAQLRANASDATTLSIELRGASERTEQCQPGNNQASHSKVAIRAEFSQPDDTENDASN